MIRMGTVGYRCTMHSPTVTVAARPLREVYRMLRTSVRYNPSFVDISSAHRCGSHLPPFKSVKYPIFYSNSIPGRKCSFLPIVLAMNPDQKSCYDGSLADTVQFTRQEEQRQRQWRPSKHRMRFSSHRTPFPIWQQPARTSWFARQHDNISETSM